MWLIVRSGPDAGTALEVTGKAVLGRQAGCELIVRDTRASRRHVELVATEAGLRLRDLKSANGTYVDGSRVSEADLSGGEEIRIGSVIIEVWRERPTDAASDGHSTRPAPTYSSIRRLVQRSTRRTQRIAVAAAALGGVALLALVVVLVSGGGDPVPRVVERLGPSTVLVLSERPGAPGGTGSGWVFDAREGLIVTTGHVLNEGDRFTAVVDGRRHPAGVAGIAPCEDLALLKLDGTAGLQAAPMASGAALQPGETVVALGFGADARPGDPVSSTAGVVSVARTAFRDPAPDVPAYPEVVQTDTALNPGNSGGPLADTAGRVIAINAAARTASGGRPLQNVNYGIRIDHARPVLEQLRRGRARGWTGLTFGYPSEQSLRAARLPAGLRVTGAIAGTPAAAAIDEIPPGSLIAAVNGRPIGTTLQSLCDVIADVPSGEEVELSLAEPGETTTRQVRLRMA